MFIAEYENRAAPGDREIAQADRFVSELHPDYVAAARALTDQPIRPASLDVMNAGLDAEGVASSKCFGHPRQAGDRQARADGVAGPKQCSEIDPVHGPERGGDQMVPA